MLIYVSYERLQLNHSVRLIDNFLIVLIPNENGTILTLKVNKREILIFLGMYITGKKISSTVQAWL